jgi:hypothetical protein
VIRDAREFLRGLDVDQELIERIATALGKDLLGVRDSPRRVAHDLTPSLLAYARDEDWRAGLQVSTAYFFRILKALREDPIHGRVLEYGTKGLSRRDLARLFNRSLPTIQRVFKDPSTR